MKKAFAFTQTVMNGTAMTGTHVALFATRQLAEQTLADIKATNQGDLGILRSEFSDVEQVNIYETRDEIPFYKFEALGKRCFE